MPQYSATHRTNNMTDLVTQLGATAYLLIYDNSAAIPSNCAAAATGVLLASLPCSNPVGTVTGGVLTFSTITTQNASATGTPGYYRFCTSSAGTTCIIQGTAGTTGEMIVGATTSGQPVQTSGTFTLTATGA